MLVFIFLEFDFFMFKILFWVILIKVENEELEKWYFGLEYRFFF